MSTFIHSTEFLFAISAAAVFMLGGNIIQAFINIAMRADLDDLTSANDSLCTALQAETSKREQASLLNERMCADIAKADADQKRLAHEAAKASARITALEAERATLYRRNAKGQIEPITPKPRKPHTLKHGMTVKDPSPQQAKRIFAAARRAGIRTYPGDNDVFKDVHFSGLSVCGSKTGNPAATTYISAREFIRRIKGEIE
jgi:hypothetical protein